MALSPLTSLPAAVAPAAAPVAPQPAATAVTPPAPSSDSSGAGNATAGRSPAQDPAAQDASQGLDKALQEINHSMDAWSTSLHFEVDPEAQRLVVSVLDAKTGEVLRTIPSEAVIRVAKMIVNLQGQAVTTRA